MRFSEGEYGVEILWADEDGQLSYDGLSYSHLPTIKQNEKWKENIYLDMCDLLNEAGEYIDVITKLDANNRIIEWLRTPNNS